MLHAWGRAIARWRWFVIAAAAAGIAAAAVLGPAVFGALSSGGFHTKDSEAARAADRITATVGRQDVDIVALYRSGRLTVDDPAFRRAVAHSLAALPAADVAASATYYSTHSPALVSADRHATYATIRLAAATEADRMTVYQRTSAGLRDTGSDTVSVSLGGVAAINGQINTQVSEDLGRAEAISMPVLMILLVIVFGSAVAAGLPVLIGGMTVLGSFVVLRLLTTVTDVSVFAINIITIMGLGLAIDYGLFIVSRFREELAPGDVPVADALARTMATAGRTVLFSAITVAVSLSSLIVFPQVFLRSMGYGGVAAILVAASAALTVLPAILAVLGHRVDALRVRLPRLPIPRLRNPRLRDPRQQDPRQQDPRPQDPRPQDPRLGDPRYDPDGGNAAAAIAPGRWERFSRSVMRRPLAFAAAATALLIWLAIPFLHVRFGGIDERALPPGSPARVVAQELHTRFHAPNTAPIDVLVEGAKPAALTTFANRIADLPGVEGVHPTASSGAATLLAVDYSGETVDANARAVVHEIRALEHPPGADVLVGGASARSVDLRSSLATHLPVMAAMVVTTTFVLLFLAFGSFVLPLKAVLMNVLSLGASFGVVTWVFQDGHLSGLLHFTSTHTVETTQPILMLAILFGLSMDYEVFLLSRIREQWEREGDNTEAVAHGLQRTGRIITSAALLLVVVIAAFSTSGITFIKLIGVGMAVAIIIDATVVRAVLVPALMRLLGRANWWAPGPLQRWQSRYGWAESDAAVGTRPDSELTPARSSAD